MSILQDEYSSGVGSPESEFRILCVVIVQAFSTPCILETAQVWLCCDLIHSSCTSFEWYHSSGFYQPKFLKIPFV